MARITRIDTAWRNRGILHNIVCYESKGNRTNSTHPSSVSWKWSTADRPPTRMTSPLSSNGTPTNGNRVNNANGDDAGEHLGSKEYIMFPPDHYFSQILIQATTTRCGGPSVSCRQRTAGQTLCKRRAPLRSEFPRGR